MKANIVDLRYKMHDILKALGRNEKVHVLYRGRETAVIVPISRAKQEIRVEDHAMFGSTATAKKSVKEVMEELRGGRY